MVSMEETVRHLYIDITFDVYTSYNVKSFKHQGRPIYWQFARQTLLRGRLPLLN